MADNTNQPEIVAKIKFDTSDAPQTIGNLRQEFIAARKEIYETTKGTNEYYIALKKAAAVKAEITELNRVIRLLNPEEKLRAIQGIAEGAVGAFTAVRGAQKLFGDKNEEIIKSIEKLEAAMALLKGLKAFNEGVRDARALIGVLGVARKASLAQAAAAKEIGAAQIVSAEGTNVATVATKGFGVALKSIGIGLIIAAIAYLVDNWKELKKQFQSILPDMGSLSGGFNTFKTIIVGVGGAVIKALIMPIKLLISAISTTIKVFQDIKNGHWGDIFSDIGHGVKDGIEIVKDGLDVIKNFEEGAASSRKAQADERRKEELKAQVEDWEEQIELLKEKGQESFEIEKKMLEAKKELAEDEPKELKKVHLEMEKLLINHHKKLQEEEKKREEEAKKHAEKLKELQKQYKEFTLKTDRELDEARALSGNESLAVRKYKKEVVDIETAQTEQLEKLKGFLDQKFITQAEYNSRVEEIDKASGLKKVNAQRDRDKDLLHEEEEKATKEVEIVKHAQLEQENIITDNFAHGKINKEQYEQQLFDVNTLYLNKEKQILISHGQDVANIDKLIAENDIKIAEQHQKEKLAVISKANKTLINEFNRVRELDIHNDKLSFAARKKALNDAETSVLQSTTLTAEERIAIESQGAAARRQIDKLEADAKKANFKTVEGLLNSAGEAIGKNVAAGKIAAIAATTISTYQSAAAAYASQLLPGDPTSPARGYIAAAASVVSGLARVKAIIATKTPGGGVGSASNPVFTAPSTNDFSAPSIQSNTPTTNLSNDSINQISANQQQAPTQVIVSESDISGVQARVSSYSNAGTI